uniref:Uncharacterized protein n=1 Tax=Nelumbo nucifera TaxID=4432 RepID=A0A822XIK6_NELNU|nr:TPA_asm: hypothetical protein HUJ06_022817 [Nelumbo nucifera]
MILLCNNCSNRQGGSAEDADLKSQLRRLFNRDPDGCQIINITVFII